MSSLLFRESLPASGSGWGRNPPAGCGIQVEDRDARLVVARAFRPPARGPPGEPRPLGT